VIERVGRLPEPPCCLRSLLRGSHIARGSGSGDRSVAAGRMF
jgi:hypothetical protein